MNQRNAELVVTLTLRLPLELSGGDEDKLSKLGADDGFDDPEGHIWLTGEEPAQRPPGL